ncbi:hypothetical protein OHA_3_00014 (plasmid) [Pleomorphomonas sp. SM30]|nr:hypothetical protein OHA_3_00014 [Pleomorphomonas sp. SM30]
MKASAPACWPSCRHVCVCGAFSLTDSGKSRPDMECDQEMKPKIKITAEKGSAPEGRQPIRGRKIRRAWNP